MTVYYWVVEATVEGTRVFWRHDNPGYYVVHDEPDSVEDPADVETVVRSVLPDVLDVTGCEVVDFEPPNGFLPGRRTKLVVFRASNGLDVVGPVWASAETPQAFLHDAVPAAALTITAS